MLSDFLTPDPTYAPFPVWPEVLVKIDGLGARHGEHRVLDDVSFSVRAGELLGLVGPSGVGKTTLFSVLAGLHPPVVGEITSGDGLRLTPSERGALLHFVPDGISPWPGQRTGDLIADFAQFWGAPAERRDALIERLGLAPRLETRVGSLSKGERKRFLLALGLVAPQPLLLLDEPFDGLDRHQAQDVAGLLRDEVAGGRALLLSIHPLADQVRLCDRLLRLVDGCVACEEQAEDLGGRARSRAADSEGVLAHA